jgi:hypothetical protein
MGQQRKLDKVKAHEHLHAVGQRSIVLMGNKSYRGGKKTKNLSYKICCTYTQTL